MEPPAQVPKLGYSSVVKRMMASMGYKKGEGLGKKSGGITEPIEDSTHKGRRGLGYLLDGLEKEDVVWEQEEVDWKIYPEWLESSQKPVLSAHELESWKGFGMRKKTIADETDFCDPDVLHKILSAKSVFDDLSNKEFLDARQRSNPFETIKGALFQNRAAMKMANMDADFGWMFTGPRAPGGKPLISSFDILYFADICAGPGGFSEYVLWRRKWGAKGFGFTLKDPQSGADFKLDQFLAAPSETFDPHYGVDGYDGDGDVTRPDNLQAFREYVLEQTGGKGVHFVMADGGISVEGQENIQEILTKQLVLCQYTCALSILRKGGHFVCKVFDMFTPFSVGLLYLLYRCFNKICIFKPVTSRPANSERYIVGYGLLANTDAVHAYLFSVNEDLHRVKDTHTDVLQVVPPSVLDEEDDFTSYVTSFNNRFGVNQILHLRKLQYFVKNSNLYDMRQASIKRQCLEYWKVPLIPRTPLFGPNAQNCFEQLWKGLQQKTGEVKDYSVLSSHKFQSVSMDNLDLLKDMHSWKWCWACGKRYMLIGLGRSSVHGWDLTSDRKPSFNEKHAKEWQGLELPKGTLIEVECIPELTGKDTGQMRRNTVYIMDVISIYDEIVGHKPFKERMQLAEKLCKVVNKPCRRNTVPLKTKRFFRISEAQKQFSRLERKKCKGDPIPSLTTTVSVEDEPYIIVKGIIFSKHVRDPWHLHLNRKGVFYYYNAVSRISQYECPPTSVSSYLSMVAKRNLWILTQEAIKEFGVTKGSHDKQASHLTFSFLLDAISQNST